jgi:protein phosphatase
MGTTVAAVLLRGNQFEASWVGDSRVYIYSDHLEQITRDHSYVQELVDQGAITQAEAQTSPHRNIVTQALGVTQQEQLKVGTVKGTLAMGEQLLLCSDGLNGEVTGDSIASILSAGFSVQEAVDQLIWAALDNGGSDNVTVLLIRRVR